MKLFHLVLINLVKQPQIEGLFEYEIGGILQVNFRGFQTAFKSLIAAFMVFDRFGVFHL